MAEYQVSEFTLEQRIEVAIQMLVPVPTRPWGLVTALTRQYHVSRTLLYDIRDQALAALTAGLCPREAGRPATVATLTVDKACIDRASAILPLLKGSVRDIRLGLDLLLGVKRSVGYVSETLQTAGAQAAAHNVNLCVPVPLLGEADEIFQGRPPCLTVVDGRSFLVLNLTPVASRDATTWGVTYLDLLARGLQFQDLACDGGTGLRAGAKEAKLSIPLRPDLFHLLQEAHRLSRRLEAAAYKAMVTADRARRAAREATAACKRRGPRLKHTVPVAQAELAEAQAISLYDQREWLLREVRQALDPVTPAGDLCNVAHAQATLETAIALLKELPQAQIGAFAQALAEKLPELLAPLTWLAQQVTPLLADLPQGLQRFLLWTGQQRCALKLDSATLLPDHVREVGHAVWEMLDLFHRSSSLAESLHSWLRPYLQIHRGMPQWLFPLLQLFWNYHEFERGQRAGSSPVELAGVENAPSLKTVLEQLFGTQPTAQAV